MAALLEKVDSVVVSRGRSRRSIRVRTFFSMLLHGATPLPRDHSQCRSGNSEGVAIDEISSQVSDGTQDPGPDEPE